jgi:hypothetical protein
MTPPWPRCGHGSVVWNWNVSAVSDHVVSKIAGVADNVFAPGPHVILHGDHVRGLPGVAPSQSRFALSDGVSEQAHGEEDFPDDRPSRIYLQ